MVGKPASNEHETKKNFVLQPSFMDAIGIGWLALHHARQIDVMKRSYPTVSLSGANYVSGLPKMDCGDVFVRFLCTAGEGMSQLVIDELKELANGITQFPGKVVFRAKFSDLPNLLNLKLVERIFLCILSEPLDSPTLDCVVTDNSTPVQRIIKALEKIDLFQFSQSIYLWERSCRETALVDSDAVRPGFPISARLFVKLRPKCLIRYTESVRRSAEQFLERRINTKFTQNAKLEINLMLSNNILFLGLPLTKEPISKRIYTLHRGLRPTSATAIVMHIQHDSMNGLPMTEMNETLKGQQTNTQVSSIRVSDRAGQLCIFTELVPLVGKLVDATVKLDKDGIVLDPMCGKGILLCEAASSCKKRMLSERESTKQSPFYLIGSDCSLNQLTHARDNLSNMQSSLIWDLVLCTIERTPFRAGVCDSVACDLPFGYKYGAYTRGSEEFNHMAVQRCHRNCAELLRSTLRSGGEFRLLVATRLSNWFMGLLSNMDLTVIHTYPISMGATKAVIISGRKNPG